MTEKIVEGSTETVGRLGAGYAGVQNEREKGRMQPLKDDAEGSQEFLNTLKHNPDESLTDLERTKSPEVKERLESLIDKVKSGELQLNDGKKSSGLSKEDQEFVDTLSQPQFPL